MSATCNVTKQEMKQSIALLWKKVQEDYVAKSDLPSQKQQIVVVNSKDEILTYQKNILYIVGGVPHYWDTNELKPLKDSKINDVFSAINETKDDLYQYIADEIENVLGTLDTQEFIDNIYNKLPRVTAEKAGFMTATDKLNLEETRVRLLELVDRDDVNNWFGDILKIED